MWHIKQALSLLIKILKSDIIPGRLGIPLLGCGLGGLTYEEVLPTMFERLQPYSADIIIPPNKLYGKSEYYHSFAPGVETTSTTDRRISLSGYYDDVPF